MSVSYKKLWKLLIDRDLKKKDLEEKAGVSHYVVNKLTHGENVTTDVLGRICKALDCTLDDIMEFIDEQSFKAEKMLYLITEMVIDPSSDGANRSSLDQKEK